MFFLQIAKLKLGAPIHLAASLRVSISTVNEDYAYLAVIGARGIPFNHVFHHSRIGECTARIASDAAVVATCTIAFGHTHPIAEVCRADEWRAHGFMDPQHLHLLLHT